MPLSQSRKFEHQPGEKLDYWQKQYNKLGHNLNGLRPEYQGFLHEAIRIKERNGVSLNTLELNLFKQKNEGWNFNKFRQLSKEAIPGLSSEERVQYRDFLVSKIHTNKPLVRAQVSMVIEISPFRVIEFSPTQKC